MTNDDSEESGARVSISRGDATDVGEPPARRQRLRAARRLLRAEVYYGLALLAFAVLTFFSYFNAYFGWDERIAHALQTLPVPGLFELMRLVSLVGNSWTPYALTALTAFVFFALRRNSEAFGLLLSAAGSGILNRLVKTLIHRPRPTSDLAELFYRGDSYSFPSGHVTFYVCYFGFLFFVAYAVLPRGSKARGAALVLCALPVALVGFSRIILRAHWPSDTLGAYLMGGLWLAFSLHMYRRWKQRSTFHPEEAAGEN
ncbi:MAG TPA: phosphatase PAP2 family protein [Pyrinomonadaceae bacterium]|jgi:undecaprenyl-diphosphatase|nr:phosphatase PAP2 family protein [Pyrinomonadaceae bacterium]